MILSDIPVYPGRLFIWGRDKVIHGTAEASTLGVRPESRAYKLVYDDSFNLGFWIESHKTGEKKLFFLSGCVSWLEGGWAHQDFRSSDGIQVRIYNT